MLYAQQSQFRFLSFIWRWQPRRPKPAAGRKDVMHSIQTVREFSSSSMQKLASRCVLSCLCRLYSFSYLLLIPRNRVRHYQHGPAKKGLFEQVHLNKISFKGCRRQRVKWESSYNFWANEIVFTVDTAFYRLDCIFVPSLFNDIHTYIQRYIIY